MWPWQSQTLSSSLSQMVLSYCANLLNSLCARSLCVLAHSLTLSFAQRVLKWVRARSLLCVCLINLGTGKISQERTWCAAHAVYAGTRRNNLSLALMPRADGVFALIELNYASPPISHMRARHWLYIRIPLLTTECSFESKFIDHSVNAAANFIFPLQKLAVDWSRFKLPTKLYHESIKKTISAYVFWIDKRRKILFYNKLALIYI
jgi:hypothetical protein